MAKERVYEPLKGKQQKQAIKLYTQGFSQKDIARKIGVSKQRVSNTFKVTGEVYKRKREQLKQLKEFAEDLRALRRNKPHLDIKEARRQTKLLKHRVKKRHPNAKLKGFREFWKGWKDTHDGTTSGGGEEMGRLMNEGYEFYTELDS